MTGHPYVPPLAPLLLGLLIATADGQLLRVHPTQAGAEHAEAIQLCCPSETLSVYAAEPHEVRLATTVLNREVIDFVTKRVVLVNDIAVDAEWHPLGLDGSPRALLHWLLPQRLWQPIGSRSHGGCLSLPAGESPEAADARDVLTPVEWKEKAV